MPGEHTRPVAYQLRDRLQRLGWWRGVIRAHPGGVVPVGTAARILGVSIQRIDKLAQDDRITIVSGMPGGNRQDRFVPLDELFYAPTPLEAGRPMVTTVDGRRRVRDDGRYSVLRGRGPRMADIVDNAQKDAVRRMRERLHLKYGRSDT